ncbi:hypothetical protein BDW74DRAFT_179527 [Aspergillus multicolor]|uniref:uncharacterized protein n=1 Tax=Aspergillus multicolor TaxID=41759 RepID=UPI003CCD03CF
MDSQFDSFMQESSLQNLGVSGISLPSDYDPAQPLSSTPLYDFMSPNSNVQDLPMPQYSEAFPSSNRASTVENRSSGYSTLPPATSGTFANTNTNMNHPYDTLSPTSTMFEDLPRQWSAVTQSPSGPPAVGAMSRYTYFPTTDTSSATAQTPIFATAPRTSTMPGEPRSQPQPNPFAFVPGAGDTSSGTTYRISRNAAAFPSSVIPAHHRARSSQLSRARARPTSTNPSTTYNPASSTQQQTTQSQISQPVTSTAVNTSNRARPTSMISNTTYAPDASTQQQAIQSQINPSATSTALNSSTRSRPHRPEYFQICSIYETYRALGLPINATSTLPASNLAAPAYAAIDAAAINAALGTKSKSGS